MESPNFQVDYTGDIMTRAEHLYSGTIIETDAPLDNNGKASRFSPTDLLAASLSSCMMSIIVIHYDKKGMKLNPIKSEVKKIMISNPRRIGEIHIEFDFGQNKFSKDELEQLERLAHACPVANSLSNDILVVTNFRSLIEQSE